MSHPRPFILLLDARWMPHYAESLTEAGYQVLRADNYAEGLRLARQGHPHLIMVLDDAKAGIQALTWLALQHRDSDPLLPMTPLLIVAHRSQVADLRAQELPQRVQVLARTADAETLLDAIRQLLENGLG